MSVLCFVCSVVVRRLVLHIYDCVLCCEEISGEQKFCYT